MPTRYTDDEQINSLTSGMKGKTIRDIRIHMPGTCDVLSIEFDDSMLSYAFSDPYGECPSEITEVRGTTEMLVGERVIEAVWITYHWKFGDRNGKSIYLSIKTAKGTAFFGWGVSVIPPVEVETTEEPGFLRFKRLREKGIPMRSDEEIKQVRLSRFWWSPWTGRYCPMLEMYMVWAQNGKSLTFHPPYKATNLTVWGEKVKERAWKPG